MEIAAFIFVFFIAYTLIIYPKFAYFWAKFSNKRIASDLSYQPNVTVYISAYNEEDLIEDCIESVFSTNYPKEKLTVIVGSDGSSDTTNEIIKAKAAKYSNLKCFYFQRIGKNAVLNEIVPKSDSELIFYLDADCRPAKDAISIMASYFADETIGGVIASMVYQDANVIINSGQAGESSYQDYQRKLRVAESKIHSTVSSLGALYAIRRTHWKPLPNDRVCDDLVPLLDVNLARKRVVFSQESVVFEVRKKSLTGEFTRRSRIAAGVMASIWYGCKLLLPKYGVVSFFLWSHRLFRLLLPIFFIGLAIVTVILAINSLFWYYLLLIQIAFYLFAIIGWIVSKIGFNIKALKLPFYFTSMLAGLFWGLCKFVARSRNSAWEQKIN